MVGSVESDPSVQSARSVDEMFSPSPYTAAHVTLLYVALGAYSAIKHTFSLYALFDLLALLALSDVQTFILRFAEKALLLLAGHSTQEFEVFCQFLTDRELSSRQSARRTHDTQCSSGERDSLSSLTDDCLHMFC